MRNRSVFARGKQVKVVGLTTHVLMSRYPSLCYGKDNHWFLPENQDWAKRVSNESKPVTVQVSCTRAKEVLRRKYARSRGLQK